MMSPNYRLQGGVPIDLPTQVKNPAGQVFYSVRFDNMMIFMDEEGRFCNKAFNYGSESQVWAMGTLSQTAAVPIDLKLTERPVKTIGMRVIFNGINAGQISFQEVWVSGATILNSQTRNFDQFAKEVEIGPFKFAVLGTVGDKIKLQYDIATRFQPTSEQLSRMR
jgi:hypothetical protein